MLLFRPLLELATSKAEAQVTVEDVKHVFGGGSGRGSGVAASDPMATQVGGRRIVIQLEVAPSGLCLGGVCVCVSDCAFLGIVLAAARLHGLGGVGVGIRSLELALLA